MADENKKMEVINFLRKRIAELTDNPRVVQEPNDDEQIKELGMDSVKTINLIIQIEQQFEIAFEDEELNIDFFATIELFAVSILDKLGIQA